MTTTAFTLRLLLDPVASTTPRGLPARGPRSAPGSDTWLEEVSQ
jgi:hypothetical protein